MAAEKPKSTLYTNTTIITVNHKREIILDGAMLVVGNKIRKIGKTSLLASSSS
jgi:cytosine/adenosine deaminase-related metal-dependent hydrolase